MEHIVIELDQLSEVQSLIVYHRDFNLNKVDNVDTLPNQTAVYAICGRVNNQPANCRFIGITDDLRATLRKHFELEEDENLKNFMQSIKTKILLYKVFPSSDHLEIERLKENWTKLFKPQCTEEMNEVY